MIQKSITIANLPNRQQVIKATGEKLGMAQDIGDACGLQSIKMFREILEPGHRSSSPHRHTAKEEFIYVVDGTPTVVMGDQEALLQPGQGIAFLPDDNCSHVIVNNSDRAVTMLIISNNPIEDEVVYGDYPGTSNKDLLITRSIKNVCWVSLCDLYQVTKMGIRDPEQLKQAFTASFATAIAYSQGRIVGAGRILSDGIYYANIYDIAVTPDHQARGIGSAIVADLLTRVPNMFVLLTSTTGKEGFYKKAGFKRHKTAMALYPDHKQENSRGQRFANLQHVLLESYISLHRVVFYDRPVLVRLNFLGRSIGVQQYRAPS